MVAHALYWTTADLDAMPDDGGWLRHEIVEGELFVTRAPHIRHQGISGNIHFELEFWSRQTKIGKPFQSPGLVFIPTNAQLQLVATLLTGDTLTSLLLPGFKAEIDRIFLQSN